MSNATAGTSRSIAASAAVGLLLLVATAVAQASLQFVGTVVGRDGAPRAGVAVDVLGPSKVYTETDASGRFTVRLRPGSYVFRVRDGGRRMEFPQQVGPDGGGAVFRLAW